MDLIDPALVGRAVERVEQCLGDLPRVFLFG